MTTLIDKAHKYINDIVVSLGSPKSDNPDWQIKTEEVNVQLNSVYHASEHVTINNNANLGNKGRPFKRFYRDDFHLTREGTAVLVSNMKKALAIKNRSLTKRKILIPQGILNKAADLLGFKGEMLKAGISYLLKPVTKLFNLIFTNFSLPDIWRKSSLTPIHKKGDCFIPSNYRGIAISNILCKVLCKILNTRLNNYLEKLFCDLYINVLSCYYCMF